MADHKQLREEIRQLGEMLGDVLKVQAGDDAFQLVEDVRALAKARRADDDNAEAQLMDCISGLTPAQLSPLIHALSVFFDLANLAEDRHRVRVLRERERQSDTGLRGESVAAGIARMKDVDLGPAQVQRLLDRLQVELVFTAHPTEAKRRSIREKVRDLRGHLYDLDDEHLLPRERDRLHDRIRADITGLWQTDFVRFRRPSVLEELDRSLFFAGNLWNVTPRLFRDLREALSEHYPDHAFDMPALLRFGTWIGGDRDGNPYVTAEVTRQALHMLRGEAMQRHIDQARSTRRNLSMSTRKVNVSQQLLDAIANARDRWPVLEDEVAHLSRYEPYRQWTRIIEWRLQRAAEADLLSALPDGAYADSEQFADDLRLMRESLRTHGGTLIDEAHLEDWLCQAEVFGFHLMRMDIRQESSWYHAVMNELLQAAGIHDDYASLNEQQRQRVLSDSLGANISFDDAQLSENARETLALFRLLAAVCAMSGSQALGAHIISMTHQPSDVLVVLWLSQWAARQRGLPDDRLPMPIAPLFETIDDLNRASDVLNAMLDHPAYSAHTKALGNTQIVMIGYSDSTKDGGYLSACWNLYDAQVAMQQAVAQHELDVVFFHGRGGSLGRGGGPAARSILSLPPHTVDAGMRITEQGEVLAERYDDPHIAHRHLEQVLSALLQRAKRDVQPTSSRSTTHIETMSAVMSELAPRSHEAYRALVDQPGFIAYFEQATPITQIEQLPIGSRPARREGERSLEKLRAIPWVFSWTQSRHLIPAWFGLGTAVEAYMQGDAEAKCDTLRTLYRQDLFFRATIDNASLALAKTDLSIARLHALMVDDDDARQAIWSHIEAEYNRSRRAILQILDQDELLAEVPWLKRSIDVRNPYVDPLNMIQLELFRRLRTLPNDSSDANRIAELIRLTIQGIAGGLRTTG